MIKQEAVETGRIEAVLYRKAPTSEPGVYVSVPISACAALAEALANSGIRIDMAAIENSSTQEEYACAFQELASSAISEAYDVDWVAYKETEETAGFAWGVLKDMEEADADPITNYYRHCGESWELGECDSYHNDRCPVCNKEIGPYLSTNAAGDDLEWDLTLPEFDNASPEQAIGALMRNVQEASRLKELMRYVEHNISLGEYGYARELIEQYELQEGQDV